MDSKLFSKCSIIREVEMNYGKDPMWQPFFSVYDIAVPLAKLIVLDCATPTDNGVAFIEEAWLDLCNIVMVDSDEEYEFFADMLAIGAIDES